MIFFDSESKVNITITDEEVYRAEQGETVWKEHNPYLICATFYNKTNHGKAAQRQAEYIGEVGEPNEHTTFTFWQDVDRFARLNERTYIFAHNAKYDIQVTRGVPQLVKLGYLVTSFSDENPFILKLEKLIRFSSKTGKEYGTILPEKPTKKLPERRTPRQLEDGTWFVPDPKIKSIIILSSTNYYQQSLAKLGKVFGLEKLDFDHDQPFTMEQALVYCHRDVEIMQTAMLAFIKFIEDEELGSFSMTVAGQAFGAYRHRFLKPETIYIHDDAKAIKTERDAYAGGRTECFHMGKVEGEVYYVDINSMYPYVMKNKLYPTKLITRWNNCTVKQLRDKIMDSYLICCDVLIHTDIPIFHKKDKRLIFPVGEYWTSLSTPEIIQALDRGLIKEVKNICIYECDDLFSEYVNYFYNKRLEARELNNEVLSFLYKLFLNVLYGKFGQKKIEWEKIADAPPDEIDVYTVYDPKERTRETFKVFGGGVWKRHSDPTDEEAFNSFPAIAAHVTAYARMLLWECIECVGMENIYYSDTDSIMCNLAGYENLKNNNYLDENVLGKLKLEDKGVLELYGCKDYIFNDSVKIKGISKNATKLPDSPDGHLRFAVTQWGGFSERLKNKNMGEYANRVIIKQLKREYNKGEVIGNKIKPYYINEPEEQRQLHLKYLKGELHDLYNEDYIKTLCKIHGYIKVVQQGEYYYSEYINFPKKARIKYFRINGGIPLDVWCMGAGIEVNDFIEQLNSIK
jgi:hypothetical protein